MSSRGVVKVTKFLGAATDDMYHYLMPLTQKQPDVILHVGTNDASSCNSSDIVNNILKLRLFVSQKLPNANIILLKPIMRSDKAAGKGTIEEVNKQLNDFDFDMTDNSNLLRAHLNGTLVLIAGFRAGLAWLTLCYPENPALKPRKPS